MSIWKEKDKSGDILLYNDTENFFEGLSKPDSEAEYRLGQHNMAIDVVDAINNKEISLIEAGVGIGKTWGYLVPLLLAVKDKPDFKGFIISTSSIALQEQLKREIKLLREKLNVDIDVVIAKGRNNYICQRRLDSYIDYHPEDENIKMIVPKVEMGIIDKEEYASIPKNVWSRINVNQTNCFNCFYKKNCHYFLNRRKLPDAHYVICNHDLLIESLKRDSMTTILANPDILIIDEAHTFEEKISNSYKKIITKGELEALIRQIKYHVNAEADWEYYDEDPCITILNRVFRDISTRAKYQYISNARIDTAVLDNEYSGFTVTSKMKNDVNNLIGYFDRIINRAYSHKDYDAKLSRYVVSLKEYKGIFKDLISKDSKNVYIATFLPNTIDHIALECIPKNIPLIAASLLGDKNYGKVFTSATMTTDKNDYSYFIHNLGLDKIKGIALTQEYSQESPYDYDNNALLYLDKTAVSPKSKDRDLYISSIASKVEELVNITDGRSLVLFTSKKDMQDVYSFLNNKDHDFNLLVQNDNISNDNLKKLFIEDMSSVLLATGSFWEGIDVKGDSLVNVIIPKLPFPIVEPIIQNKAAYYRDAFREVYLKEMLIKLKQGAGRLIRDENDHGVVAILDSRIADYEDEVVRALPFSNITDNIEDIKSFAAKKLSKTRKN